MSTPAKPGYPTALPAILLAIQSFDAARIVEVLDDEADERGLDALVDDVVFPTLRIVGTYWASGSFNVSHEHLFTATVTRWIHGRLEPRPAPHDQRRRRSGPAPQIVLAAGPDDLHVLGLDCLELLLVDRHIAVCNLGALVPASSLVETALAVGATTVVVCSHAGTGATSAFNAAASLHTAHAAGLAVHYAGSSFDSSFIRRRLPGVALTDSVAASAALLTGVLTDPPVDDPRAACLTGRETPSFDASAGTVSVRV